MEQKESRRQIAAVVFDLGGTLVDWPDWDTAAEDRWSSAYDYVLARLPEADLADRAAFVGAMRSAELAHWQRVEQEYRSSSPSAVVQEGFVRLGRPASDIELVAALDGYARAVAGWAQVFPDSRPTLLALQSRGYRLGLLSNTWWAADWHNADLAAHSLGDLLDALVYTSDLPRSKPHPSVFKEVARRLGVAPERCMMVGDRPVDDIQGGLGAGMLAVLKTNGQPRPIPNGVEPTAMVETLSELPPLLERLG